MEKVHEEVYRGFTIEVYPDDMDDSPNNWGEDGLFLVALHRDFNVEREGFPKELCQSICRGGKYEDGSKDHSAIETMKKYHCFNLEAYIHSGVRLALENKGHFPDRQWDVSVLGIVFVSKEEARTRGRAQKRALGLIKTWNDYLSGNVYGYSVEGVFSCWGYYGDFETSGLLESAKREIDAHIDSETKRHCAKRKAQILARTPLYARKSLCYSTQQ